MAADAARERSESAPPMVDVVVATNRRSPYLDEALASVQAQTWPLWRLIVVDDGSPVPEEIRASCERVGARYIRQEPQGVAAARNTGLRATSGGLLSFLDDDDVWRPERLAREIEVWEASGRCAAVYSGGWYIDGEGKPLNDSWPAITGTREEFLTGRVPIPFIVTLLVRRDVAVDVGGFNEGLRYSDDDDFILRVISWGDVRPCHAELTGYRRHASNLTNAAFTVRHCGGERVVRGLIAGARESGDRHLARQFRENLRRFRSRGAYGWTGRMVVAVRQRDIRAMREDTWWSFTRAPGSALHGLGARVARRLSRRRRADAR